MDQKLVVTVYATTRKGLYYILDPVSKKPCWLTHALHQKLEKFCRFEKHVPAPQNNRFSGTKWFARQYYILFNTADRNTKQYPEPNRFAVPLIASEVSMVSRPDTAAAASWSVIPTNARIVGVRLHKAVVPKSQNTIHSRNNVVVVQRSDTQTQASIELKPGHYNAHDLAQILQAGIRDRLNLPDFTVALDLTTGTFRLACPSAPFAIVGKGTTCHIPLGLTGQKLSYTWASNEENGEHVVRTNHANVSGSQLLVMTVRELKDDPVAHIPMYDLGAGRLVFYHNPETGGDPRPQHARPLNFGRLTCTLRDEYGDLYDFNGINGTYVFEIICLDCVTR